MFGDKGMGKILNVWCEGVQCLTMSELKYTLHLNKE
jgi:hypothetical protein